MGANPDAVSVGIIGSGGMGARHAETLSNTVSGEQRSTGHPIESDWLERFPTAYVLETRRWIEDLRDGRLTGPDAWDGYNSLVAVESWIASLSHTKHTRCCLLIPRRLTPMCEGCNGKGDPK